MGKCDSNYSSSPPAGTGTSVVEDLHAIVIRACEELGVGPEEHGEILIDLDSIYLRSGNSTRRTLLIMRAYLSCFEEVIGRLEDALAHQDRKALRDAVHTQKGLLLDVGAAQYCRLASEIEKECPAASSDQLTTRTRQMEECARRIGMLIQRIVKIADNPAP